ncbi:MAG: hypothetical protein JWN62_4699 [Acidimicrobiales bacterium]|nr:hypothetical protein [Acidimicrobiales bacterium]
MGRDGGTWSGTLAEGTDYAISIPEHWNGTLVNDLDAVINISADTPVAKFLLDHGYAYSGTNRRVDRDTRFDPRAERDEQAQVLDIFNREFGSPQHALQYGCSGGGAAALGVAETYPDHFDGAISMNGVEPIVISNIRLDLLFALKALLAPDKDLPVVGVGTQQANKAGFEWRMVLEAAAATAVGRAQMALAGSLAQLPVWAATTPPYPDEPDPNDPVARERSVVHAVFDAALYAVGTTPLYNNPAGVMCSNNDVDYTQFYANAETGYAGIVESLYRHAGLSSPSAIRADLDRINAHPRVKADPAAVEYWSQRALSGNLRMPLLQLTTIGDGTRSDAMMAAYAEAVTANEKSHLYRQALVNAAGHCTANVTEIAAALAALTHRLQTGAWDDSTTADTLNTTGLNLGLDDNPRFISPTRVKIKANRTFFR